MLCLALGLVALAVLIRRFPAPGPRTRDPRFTVRARRFAPVCMAIFALLVTQAAFDWIGGLTPAWYSDVLGVYLFAGSFMAGLAASTLALLYLRARDRLMTLRFDHFYSLGGFLFAFTVFWAYIAFAQYMLMWYGNLPDEVGLVPGAHRGRLAVGGAAPGAPALLRALLRAGRPGTPRGT